MSSRSGDYSKKFVVDLLCQGLSHWKTIVLEGWPPLYCQLTVCFSRRRELFLRSWLDARRRFTMYVKIILYVKIRFINSFRLLVHLERLGSLPENTVRFYTAEIASALAFLHQHRIMHRLVRGCSSRGLLTAPHQRLKTRQHSFGRTRSCPSDRLQHSCTLFRETHVNGSCWIHGIHGTRDPH